MIQKPNILLIVIDAVRADHLGCYGYHRKTTPCLDSIAHEGVLFENAFANSGYTLLSHGALFCGKFPSHSGLLRSGESLPAGNLTLAEILRRHGYQTYGLHPSSWLGSQFGLDQGFEKYIGSDDLSLRYLSRYLRRLTPGARKSEQVKLKYFAWRLVERLKANFQGPDSLASIKVQIFRDWIKNRNQHVPFFGFLHFMETHQPYRSPVRFRKQFQDSEISASTYAQAIQLNSVQSSYEIIAGERQVSEDEWRALISWYDAALAYVDYRISEIMDFLHGMKLLDETLVIITADHGEAFGEHGLAQHFFSLYENLIHVPLIFRFPTQIQPGQKTTGLVSHIDILPTILSLLEIDEPYGVGGVNLLPVRDFYHEAVFAERYEEAKPLRRLFPERDFSQFIGHWQAVRTANYKYIRRLDPSVEWLFDLVTDPAESINTIQSKPDQASIMRTYLNDFVKTASPPGIETQGADLDAALIDRLKMLGYL